MLREKTAMLRTPGSAKSGISPSTALRSKVINLTEQMVVAEAEAILATCNDPGLSAVVLRFHQNGNG